MHSDLKGKRIRPAKRTQDALKSEMASLDGQRQERGASKGASSSTVAFPIHLVSLVREPKSVREEVADGQISGAQAFPLQLAWLVSEPNSVIEGLANGQSQGGRASGALAFPLQLASLVSEPNSVLEEVDETRAHLIRL